mmetsp:Transcript_2766/g.8857  ORF Transcript_2766/g.8857 Transcript_2766/m.8857 type:complete len:294 (-) Transcript_2766:132-1013(-)
MLLLQLDELRLRRLGFGLLGCRVAAGLARGRVALGVEVVLPDALAAHLAAGLHAGLQLAAAGAEHAGAEAAVGEREVPVELLVLLLRLVKVVLHAPGFLAGGVGQRLEVLLLPLRGLLGRLLGLVRPDQPLQRRMRLGRPGLRLGRPGLRHLGLRLRLLGRRPRELHLAGGLLDLRGRGHHVAVLRARRHLALAVEAGLDDAGAAWLAAGCAGPVEATTLLEGFGKGLELRGCVSGTHHWPPRCWAPSCCCKGRCSGGGGGKCAQQHPVAEGPGRLDPAFVGPLAVDHSALGV